MTPETIAALERLAARHIDAAVALDGSDWARAQAVEHRREAQRIVNLIAEKSP